ncbi:MAG: hypothetical protein DWQ04_26960 [Chloroflexi bacterium]|nr:MAG: hypothetical protein DWQ04_26960 [Chloroflexota bacterium]
MKTNGNEKRPLPNGWIWTKLESIIVNHDGRRIPVRKSDRAEMQGEYSYYGASGIIDHVDDFLFDGEFLLLAEDGANLLSRSTPIAFQARGKFWVNNHAHVMQTKNGLPLSYLEHYLNSIDLASFITGTAQPKLTQRNMNKIPVPIAHLAEQNRIVAEIEKQFTRLDQALASLKRLQSNLARYKASVLKAACEGRLVPQNPKGNEVAPEPAQQLLARILAERRAQWEAQEWQNLIVKAQKKAAQAQRKAQGLPACIKDLQPGEWESILEADYARYLPKNDKWKEKYKEPGGVETAVLPDLPIGWVWSNMQMLIIDGPTNGLYLPKSKYGKGIPILRIDDYQAGESRSSEELRKVEASQAEIQRYSLGKQNLVINRVNSPSHLGKSLVVEERNLPSLFESNMMRIELSKNLSPYYVDFYLQSVEGRKCLISNAKWAVNQASINQGDVGSTPIPIPPLAEQKRIVAEVERRLSVITATEQAITTNLARAERLRQSILHRAFTGQLIPQTEGAA